MNDVMAGLVPATHHAAAQWVAGIPRFALQPAMTWVGQGALLPYPFASFLIASLSGRAASS